MGWQKYWATAVGAVTILRQVVLWAALDFWRSVWYGEEQ